ncbi:MAG: acyl carrier protein [Alphaproteobacteria bacterium]|nr:acyl carrier protein [Alphaproteobacteria bacterium]
MTENEFQAFVAGHLKKDIAPDQDLIATGAADSFAFIDLCLAIEQKTGVVIDFAELPIEQYTTVRALYSLVAPEERAAVS